MADDLFLLRGTTAFPACASLYGSHRAVPVALARSHQSLLNEGKFDARHIFRAPADRNLGFDRRSDQPVEREQDDEDQNSKNAVEDYGSPQAAFGSHASPYWVSRAALKRKEDGGENRHGSQQGEGASPLHRKKVKGERGLEDAYASDRSRSPGLPPVVTTITSMILKDLKAAYQNDRRGDWEHDRKRDIHEDLPRIPPSTVAAS
ncbi:MAG: hypothetical protein U0452_09830 [Anaerolineae bacterium]